MVVYSLLMKTNALLEAFFDIPEAATLPLPGTGGGLPALITGLPPTGRACLAAALSERSARPLVVLCPDEASAEAIGADIAALTDAEINYLYSRDFTFYTADAVSRQGEQRRIGRAEGHARRRGGDGYHRGGAAAAGDPAGGPAPGRV